jgi:hypothetical protein
MTMRSAYAMFVVVLAACSDAPAHPPQSDTGEAESGPPPRADDHGDSGVDDEDDASTGTPGQHGEGDAEPPQTRRLRRVSAEQFHRSLVMATGQPWPSFELYAAAMGRPDYAELTEEGRELSVTFDKFVHDAAAHSCTAAVASDLGLPAQTRAILRTVELAERGEAELRTNVEYLVLRMLAQQPGTDDPRVDPWVDLLLAPAKDGELDDAEMQQRWAAVCIGLVTHTDFLSY